MMEYQKNAPQQRSNHESISKHQGAFFRLASALDSVLVQEGKMTPEEFNKRNNWIYKDGPCPPCNCCQVKNDNCVLGIEVTKECREWVAENTELLNAARVKHGGYCKLGYPCLRGNLWLLGLSYVGVQE